MRLGRLFDFDGTLGDRMPGLVAAVNAWRRERSLVEADRPAVERWVGHGVDRLLAAAGGDRPVGAEDKRRFLEIYRGAPLLGSRPFPGVEAALTRAAAAGDLIAIVTNKPREATLALVERLGWSARFAAIVCPEDAGTRKPDPAMLGTAIDQLPNDVDRWIMIGDSEVDVEASRRAGVWTAAVTWGYRSREMLARLCPDFWVEDAAELATVGAGARTT